MMKRRVEILIFAVVLFWCVPGWAQLSHPNLAGVAMGHLHYHVRDVDANKKFWMSLGGTPATIAGVEVIKFPDVFVVLTKAESSGGTDPIECEGHTK